MRKKLELPLIEPIYGTYHYQGDGTAIISSNPSIRNWYLEQVLLLQCTRKFLSGYTTPEITVYESSFSKNPHLLIERFPMQFANGYLNPIIREMLNNGYYVSFFNLDDYYLEGKTWYKERHFPHDGLICGYDQEEKTFTVYAYNSSWVYTTFKISQRSFHNSRRAMFKQGIYGSIYGAKPKLDCVEFHPNVALEKIATYLDSSMEKYPPTEEGFVYGSVVQDYIGMYLDKLIDGSVPYERTDFRVFRVIWEHKRVLLECLQKIEQELGLDTKISEAYAPLVTKAESMRMMYAAHRIKRRDTVLPVLKAYLSELKAKEYQLLSELTERKI